MTTSPGKAMKPLEFYEAIGMIFTRTVKQPFRDEPITAEEMDSFSDEMLQFIEEEKKNGNTHK